MEIDSLIANVPDIEAALRELASRIGLRPFLRFDLAEAQTSIPVALLNVGKVSLELLGHVEGERPESGVLSSVEIDAPGLDEMTFNPAPEMNIVCHPAKTPRVRSVQITSLRPSEDERLLLEQLGAVSTEAKGRVKLGSVELRLVAADPTPRQQLPSLHFRGWHRFSVKVPSVTIVHRQLIYSGLGSLRKPFRVMPGLSESMVTLPSGAILQLTQQELWKMMPMLAVEWTKSRLLQRPMRFKIKPVIPEIEV
ncbi:hypothetical protein KEJ39_00735 [Candidatus Bathyarchaeota archaeon]|nr:hypothetical protein [Candidatus Bathyarchaeota archaeon]